VAKKTEHSDSAKVLERGQHVTLRFLSLTPTGAGISKDYGRPVFVDRVAPGDLAEVEIFDVRKDFARGKVVRLLEPSPVRDKPPCPIFTVCGGCQWQHMTYEAQVDAKTDIVKQAIEHIGHLEPSLVLPTIGAAESLHYRNKVQFPVRNPQGSQRILAGYFKQDSHELVNVKFCPIQPSALDVMLENVKEVCEQNAIWAYDEKTHKGSLRHINARYSFATEKIMVTLVVNMRAKTDEEFARSPLGERLIQVANEIMSAQPQISGVCVNLNPEAGNRILGDVTLCLAGDPYIEEVLSSDHDGFPELLKKGITFRLSSSSFFQVNTRQAVRLLEVIYEQASELLKDVEKPVIVDAFAGVGTMALWLSPLAGRVIAIEEQESAVQDGELNAKRNGISNVEFRHGTVETVLPELLAQGVEPHLIILDPPRKGLSPETLAALKEFGAPGIIYASCNPATLARDLRILNEGQANEPNLSTVGYKTKQIQPVDLFPQTYHVESVTTLKRVAFNGSVGHLEET
jgi:23S rRNA (uracil1939-C5)-methyltransferase